jgi:hypothetical protein
MKKLLIFYEQFLMFLFSIILLFIDADLREYNFMLALIFCNANILRQLASCLTHLARLAMALRVQKPMKF